MTALLCRQDSRPERLCCQVYGLKRACYLGEDFKFRTDVDAIAKRVTAANLKKSARRFLDANNYVFGVMRPKK